MNMSFNRAEIVDRNFTALVSGWGKPPAAPIGADDPVRAGCPLNGRDLLELFESQMTARHLDLIARMLRARDAAFYTIGSAGHEANAVVGRLTRHTDPAFLHYRSAAFMLERARHRPEIDMVYDTVLSQAASADDPIAGGRHKVWGSKPLWVLPQTSTIASHLPKAVGTAIAIARAKRLNLRSPVPPDSIVVCSFGDATINHSVSCGAFNAARWTAHQSLPVPVLFVCEDNGIGISVPTPSGWVEAAFQEDKQIAYFPANGLDLVETHAVTTEAVEYCRTHREPVFLHLKVIRMLGHAGSDFEPEYRSLEEIALIEAQDPLLHSARLVIGAGLMTPDQIIEEYEAIRARVNTAAEKALTRPRLTSKEQVMAPLAPYHPDRVSAEAARTDYHARRIEAFGEVDKLPERGPAKHMAVSINQALFDLLAKYPEALVFGEDVAQKGGVYHVTTGLEKKFKAGRVFNTLLDETTILGLAQGFANMGLLPIPEIQYLAYFHNACDQIRGEACSLQYFSQDQYRNPMIVRIASLAYQKGFGGHFHNDNSIAALRDIPGLIVACPSRGDDAAAMLRTCAALAKVDGRVIVFLEPIALYMTKDLYEPGDGGWLFKYPPLGEVIPLGEGRIYHPGAKDLLIITYGNGTYLSLRAMKTLREQSGVHARILDLRWLNPLNAELMVRHAQECGRVLAVDEGRRTGGVAESIITAVVERCGTTVPCRRVTAEDTYIPLGPAANFVLPSEEGIVAAALQLIHTPFTPHTDLPRKV